MAFTKYCLFRWNLSSRLRLKNSSTASQQRGKIPSTSGMIWRLLIWWWGPSMPKVWRMRDIPSLPSLPGLPLPGGVAPDMILPKSQIELNSVPMLNWIAWNRIFWHVNCVLMLNWIIQNKTFLSAKLNRLKNNFLTI